jgi:prepilin-type N-terminal cleavage/methylation domain-containing protein
VRALVVLRLRIRQLIAREPPLTQRGQRAGGAMIRRLPKSGRTLPTTAERRTKTFSNLGRVKTQRGFTLIEITMCIVLVAILSTVAFTQYIDFAKDAKLGVTASRMNELRMAIVGDARQTAAGQYTNSGFINQVGQVPTSLTDLVSQGSYQTYDPYAKVGWRGPYVSTLETNWQKDAWGTLFQYSAIGRTITSCGPDRTCGTSDDIIVNF